MAQAVLDGARERRIQELPSITGFKALSGLGVTAMLNAEQVVLGNLKLMEAEHVSIGDFAPLEQDLREAGQTLLYLAVAGKAAGVLGAADPIKDNAQAALEALRSRGIRLVMLTGDHPDTARVVGKKLGIDEIFAGLLPDQKRDVIKKLQSQNRKVAMAGDGINDSPALAQADVGIAMGSGTDIAIQSAGIILIKCDLSGLVRALNLSRATIRNIRQNLFFAFLYNALGVPVAAGILFPHFGILLSPMLASAAMSASSVSVIWNALRLRRSVI